ncbi:SPOR domain-containing protein [Coprobacter tertius]|uniref:SPOR domain-containing protein n=1 Tax=Coprobacter tertius TaxID=2944915 RepID=A0ABT1MJX1_9BACT|nr:SPOR domain-containing protein [Coprobacter tertius]MCP9612918.1 SPOR domain-containing protein [Coprobacter tertius]
MKKNWLLIISAIAIAVGMGSCKAKESAYKAAYEKAQEKTVAETTPAPEPVVTKPVTNNNAADNTVRVSSEKITTVNSGDASKLKLFNVVVGSFTIQTNANGLTQQLVADGYNAFVVRNAQGMYRVIVGSFDDRPSATNLRESVKARYNKFDDAWLLINE